MIEMKTARPTARPGPRQSTEAMPGTGVKEVYDGKQQSSRRAYPLGPDGARERLQGRASAGKPGFPYIRASRALD